MIVKYGDNKAIKVVIEDEVYVDDKKVRKSLNETKKNIKKAKKDKEEDKK